MGADLPGSRLFDHEAVTMMCEVCDAAWHEVLDNTTFISELKEREARRLMVQRVMTAVVEGERDRDQLRKIALNCFYG